MGGVNLAGTENLTTQNQITAGFNLASGDRGCVPTFSAVICNIDTPHPQISNSVIHCLNYSYYFRKHHFSSDAQSKFNLVVGYDPAHWCPTNQRHQRDSWPPQAAAPWRPTVLRHRASSGGSPIRTQPKNPPQKSPGSRDVFFVADFPTRIFAEKHLVLLLEWSPKHWNVQDEAKRCVLFCVGISTYRLTDDFFSRKVGFFRLLVLLAVIFGW